MCGIGDSVNSWHTSMPLRQTHLVIISNHPRALREIKVMNDRDKPPEKQA
ncbi:hypothetical protein [Vulcanisaeta souniana]|nr:hypothetical protein [Vulcanisaeta souniana]